MSHFCGMLGHALKQEFGALAERVEQEEEGEEQRQAEAVGLPLDERIAWKRVANQRRLKATEFVQDPEASWGNLVWLIIASPILTLHWKLFKHAKWSVEIDTAKEELGSIIKKFCVPSLNPASDVIDSLLDMLRNSSQALRVAALFHGSLEQWSEQRLKTFQQLVLVASGQLWRKLVMPWLVFPWRLWPLVWGDSREAKLAAAQHLLAQQDCCLDQPFTQKLRRLSPDAEFLLQPDMQEFLEVVFTRLVATSTFVERRFASYGAWVARRSAGCRLATLAAKHVTSCLKEFVSSWKQRVQPERQANARSRPVWETSAQKGQRSTGLHVFCQDFKRQYESSLQGQAWSPARLAAYLRSSRAAWEALTREEKAVYSRRAQEKNALARAAAVAQESQEDLQGGPWDMACLRQQWPLDTKILKAAMDRASFQAIASTWKRAHSEEEVEAENVNEEGERSVQLFATCSPCGCHRSLSQQQQRSRAQLQANLCTLVRAEFPQANKLGTGPLLLRFRSANSQQVLDYVVAFATRMQPPECALLQLQAAPEAAGAAVLELPTVVDRDARTSSFCSDHDVSVRLAQSSSAWSVSVLRCGHPGKNLNQFVVEAEECFSQEDLDKKRQQMVLEEAALRAARAAQGHQRSAQRKASRNKRQEQRRGARKPPKRRTAKGREEAVADRAEAKAASSDTSSAPPGLESDTHSEAGSVLSWSDLEDAAPSTSAARASHEDLAVAPPPPLPPVPGRATKTRSWHRRGFRWGPFTISPIVRGGALTAYGAVCGLHANAGERLHAVYCKKAGALRELVVRLKRWLVAGILQQQDWSLHELRKAHVQLQLETLATGPSEAQLDQWMDGFMARAAETPQCAP